MNTFLFTWNPKKWDWSDRDILINNIKEGKPTIRRWSVTSHKQIAEGDRFFIMCLGAEPKGIIASGYILGTPFIDKHWNHSGKEIHYSNLLFDVIIPEVLKENILHLDILKGNKYLKEINWTPQNSGSSLTNCNKQSLEELEKEWQTIINKNQIIINNNTWCKNVVSFKEGNLRETISKSYERNIKARQECLAQKGYSCCICNFNFKDFYGDIGEKFIHVHHLWPISEKKGEEYIINPLRDLVPVCANCHAMIHKRKPLYSLEEMRNIIRLECPERFNLKSVDEE